MILKKKNSTTSNNNSLKILNMDGFCCGDEKRLVVCKYSVTIDSAANPIANALTVGGTTHQSPSPIDITSEAGHEMFVKFFESVLYKEGYTQDGIEITQVGDLVTFDVYFSGLSFDSITTGANVNTFVKTECIVHGDNSDGALCCDTAVVAKKLIPDTFTATYVNQDAGETVTVRDAADNPLVTWVDDASGNQLFIEAGNAWIALEASDFEWWYNKNTNQLYLKHKTLVPASLYNETDDAEINPFLATTPVQVEICPVSCGDITNVLITEGANTLYNDRLSTSDKAVYASAEVKSLNKCVYIDAEALAYNGDKTFDVTVTLSNCDPYNESFTINFS